MLDRVLSRVALGAAALAAAALSARAESTDIDLVTVGALAERADAAVVATAAGPAERAGDGLEAWSLRVTESLRGPRADEVLRVVVPAGRTPLAPGGRFVAFLRRTETGWASMELPWSLRTTAEPGVAPLLEYARGYAACLSAEGTVAAPERLAEHLVASLRSPASGVPACAGRDLVRREDLHALLTAEQRDAVTAALRAERRPDQDLAGIVLAAGPCGGPGTDEALVARLLDPALRPQRRHVVASLRRRASPALASMLSRRLDGADAAQRADLANALGRLGLREAEPALVPLLRDESPEVRFEAAHSIGLVARAVRAPVPGADPEAPRPRLETSVDPLAAALGRAKGADETRAVLWALAQIDTQPAWEVLRRTAKDAADERTRETARRLLEQPRTSLL